MSRNRKIQNRASYNSYHREYYKKNPTKYKYYRYNLTEEKLKELLEKQDNKCAICRKPFEGKFCIDHDHKCCPPKSRSCGKCIRGLLCKHCNFILGHSFDDPTILQKAVKYLEF